MLADTDTLFVFGLDHMVTGQEATAEEVEAVRAWVSREGTRLVLGPHHDVGADADLAVREVEYPHHGDALVPRQQRFGRYTRVADGGARRSGARTATGCARPWSRPTQRIAPLAINRDLDTTGWLAGVTSFNFHMHLPHYAVTTDDEQAVRVLGRQPIDLSRPHPFTEAGNTEFNMFLWLPPAGDARPATS